MGVPEEEHHVLLLEAADDDALRRLKGAAHERSQRRKRAFLHLLGASLFLAILFSWSRPFFESGAAAVLDEASLVQTPMTSSSSSSSSSSVDGMRWEDISMCLREPRKVAKTSEEIIFGTGRSLAIVQKSRRGDGPHRDRHFRSPRVFGQVELKPIQASSTSASAKGSVDMQITSNIETLDVDVQFDRATQEFTVVTPEYVDWDEHFGACIQIHIVVSAPARANLDSLLVHAAQLNIDIVDGLALENLQRAVFFSVTGNVAAGAVSGGGSSELVTPYGLEARQLVIETVTGNVKGWFPFYDLARIKTSSGDIFVDLTPHPAAEEQQAVLDIDSISGNVLVKEKWSHQEGQSLPIRDYVTQLTTVSGNIDAAVAFTSNARVESQSGDFTLQLVPVPVQDPSSTSTPTLQTNTKSGRSQISILNPMPPSNDGAEAFLSSLVSKHSSISGNLNLQYPAAWTGEFSMTTMTGRQVVRGQDVQFSHGRGFVRRVRGSKGEGNAEITVDSMSGDEDLLVGRL